MSTRRLLGEFKRDWENGINENNSAIIDNYDHIFSDFRNNIMVDKINIFILNENYDKTILVTLDFNNMDTYPFKPPKVKINTTYDYLRILSTISGKLVKEKYGLKCMCCNSILCEWGPNYSIKKIIEECEERLDLKLRSQNINVAHMCVMKKFGHYLPIAEFL